jgi:hypothetical protein
MFGVSDVSDISDSMYERDLMRICGDINGLESEGKGTERWADGNPRRKHV